MLCFSSTDWIHLNGVDIYSKTLPQIYHMPRKYAQKKQQKEDRSRERVERVREIQS